MAPHRSRLCHLVLDCDDLDTAVMFWSAALGATEEPVNPASRSRPRPSTAGWAGSAPIYRRLRLPDAEIRSLLQRTDDEKTSKERMHLDIETDDVEAEVQRLEKLGATRWDHQQERGFDFWVLHDPFGDEFCVLQTVFPDLLKARPPWLPIGSD